MEKLKDRWREGVSYGETERPMEGESELWRKVVR